MASRELLLPLVVAILIGAPCSAQNAAVDRSTDSCSVTSSQNPPFLPQSPGFHRPTKGEFWYGSDQLWILLGNDGTWSEQAPPDCDGFCTKLTYWSEDFDWRREPHPKLSVTAHRLDHEAPLVMASRAKAVFVTGPLPAAMMVGIDVPASGCWEITAKYRGQKLSFVRSVRLDRHLHSDRK